MSGSFLVSHNVFSIFISCVTPASPSPVGYSDLIIQLLKYHVFFNPFILFSEKFLYPCKIETYLIKSIIDLYLLLSNLIKSPHSFTYFALLNGRKVTSLLSLIFTNIAFLNL